MNLRFSWKSRSDIITCSVGANVIDDVIVGHSQLVFISVWSKTVF